VRYLCILYQLMSDDVNVQHNVNGSSHHLSKACNVQSELRDLVKKNLADLKKVSKR
jgi:hypothetical protein